MPTYIQFKKLLDSQKINKKALAESLESSFSTINNIYKGLHSPKVEIIERLKDEYPSLDLNWLIAGKGSMWVDEGSMNSAEEKAIQKENKRLKEELEKAQDLIRRYEESQAIIKDANDALKKYIGRLEDELRNEGLI